MSIVTANGKRYVTYLEKNNKFNIDMCSDFYLFSTTINKPQRAWWGSPEDAYYGWKEWCKSEEFGEYDFTNPIRWHLKEGSKVFQIDWSDVTEFTPDNKLLEYINIGPDRTNLIEDIDKKIKLLKHETCYYPDAFINFGKMKTDGITAVELLDSCIGHQFCNRLEEMFNSWDCESIVVLDEKAIIFE